jgi:hypothetical protein
VSDSQSCGRNGHRSGIVPTVGCLPRFLARRRCLETCFSPVVHPKESNNVQHCRASNL